MPRQADVQRSAQAPAKQLHVTCGCYAAARPSDSRQHPGLRPGRRQQGGQRGKHPPEKASEPSKVVSKESTVTTAGTRGEHSLLTVSKAKPTRPHSPAAWELKKPRVRPMANTSACLLAKIGIRPGSPTPPPPHHPQQSHQGYRTPA